jgi:7-cyano-7-deazaguanine synthase
MDKPKALLLFSGGFDSVVLLHEVLQLGYNPELLFVEYGQRNHEWELAHAEYWKEKYNLQLNILPLNLSWSNSALLTKGEISADEVDNQYLEMRNLIFLSYALSYAEHNKIWDIFFGILGGTYNDASPQFAKLFDSLAYNTTGIQVSAPFSLYSKDQVKDYAVNVLHLDMKEILEHTISCNVPDPKTGEPCGICLDCKVINEYKKEFFK